MDSLRKITHRRTTAKVFVFVLFFFLAASSFQVFGGDGPVPVAAESPTETSPEKAAPAAAPLQVQPAVPAAIPSVVIPAAPPSNQPPVPNIYAEEFFMRPDQRLQHETEEVSGFIFIKSPNRQRQTNYAVVTGFKGSTVQTIYVPGMETPKDLKNWLEKSVETSTFETVEIRKVKFPASQEGVPPTEYYWVGNRAFSSADQARSQIALAKTLAESQGGNFAGMVREANKYLIPAEEKPPVEIKSQAQFQKEEEIALRWMDQLDIGEKLFGPFQGEAPGEPIVWQSFGETTWRMTNLESKNFSDQVAFWTNRVVFKGIRFPLNTVDPYVEFTAAMESNGVDFKSNLKYFAGLEWRPFQRNPWLENYRPFGDIPLLIWVKNYRFYVQYGNRTNIKDEITGSTNHNLQWGTQIFFEFGVEPPPLVEPDPVTVSDYLRKYVWGEYFGNYYYDMTNFGAEDDYDAVIFNSSIILGVKLPGIPLPENPINDQLVFMPYMKFEHVNNTEFSEPASNQYFVAAGLRWMPFSNYRYKDSEWLSKVKIFGEYVGIGKVQHAKQDGEAPNAIRYDLRFGINISSKRY